jgi:maleate isomerase
MTCEPRYAVMGKSLVTFINGAEGADRFTRQVEDAAGVKVSIGRQAAAAALRRYGGERRIAVLSPYWPVMNIEVARYFADMDFEVVRDVPL